MNLGGRVNKALKARGMTQAELAAKVETDQPNISALVTRDSIKSEMVFALADALRVNPRWLQTGQPEDDSGLEHAEGWINAPELAPDEKRLLALYRDAPEAARPAIIGVIKETLEMTKRLAGKTPTRKRG